MEIIGGILHQIFWSYDSQIGSGWQCEVYKLYSFSRYIEFDTFTPAAERGLPVARIVSHMLPQEILACAVGNDTVRRNNHVVHFTNDGNRVNEHDLQLPSSESEVFCAV
ncbi:hypothetical protein QYE76_025982 [Lolium multiflorum]|uniref:Uncharacterized protein n=1 Tax=Lolium multiflorum TaxID=4521 RepID=A0AAD8VX47_LOLMU|nr:hypothetical protein QYE76_025982 [Lolium multiflorum]